MVISQLVPFATSAGVATASLSTMTLLVGAFGNASGGCYRRGCQDRLGRINVLRVALLCELGARKPTVART
jgi:hypothetical protein